MNIVRASEAATVYYVYWKTGPGPESERRFKLLLGFLQGEQMPMLVGGTAADPRRLVTIGPLTESQDAGLSEYLKALQPVGC